MAPARMAPAGRGAVRPRRGDSGDIVPHGGSNGPPIEARRHRCWRDRTFRSPRLPRIVGRPLESSDGRIFACRQSRADASGRCVGRHLAGASLARSRCWRCRRRAHDRHTDRYRAYRLLYPHDTNDVVGLPGLGVVGNACRPDSSDLRTRRRYGVRWSRSQSPVHRSDGNLGIRGRMSSV